MLKAISRFERRGIKPTVRQIHYHFTELKPARIPNIKKAYAKLDEYITDARKKGVIEWDRIQEDQRKTENDYPAYWHPEEIVDHNIGKLYHIKIFQTIV